MKRSRPNPESSPAMSIEDQDLAVAIDRLKNDTTTTTCLKAILGHLLERFIEEDNELASLKATNSGFCRKTRAYLFT
ncbi:unnamed protein product [Heligmosomoides polygyrus]|uniref:Uncharacterized protein n=1 Tax=Heligmosomoides polygyrus TaxID=6339 RepID=A0A183FBD3_HELPZ|nr:unnamed protein product [Heligmosomoides polygyrus]